MKAFIGPTECPVQLKNNDRIISSFLCTPQNLSELALGHLITRGLIEDKDAVSDIIEDFDNGIVDVITVNPLGEELYTVPQFVISGNSTVGYFSGAVERLGTNNSDFEICLADIKALAKKMVTEAPIYKITGGVHAATLMNEETVILREDIGRHCAVDKLVGAGVNSNIDFYRSVICTTGRISLDMVLKAAVAGFPIVASLKSVSSMAYSLAQRLNITVIGQVMGEEPAVYTADWRVKDIC